jgi:hypothetical protein
VIPSDLVNGRLPAVPWLEKYVNPQRTASTDAPWTAPVARAGTTNLRAAGAVAITVTTAVGGNDVPTVCGATPSTSLARRERSPRF